MATLAVFGVLGGGAYAASTIPKNSVTSKSVKNNSLTGKDVKEDSLAGLVQGEGVFTGQVTATTGTAEVIVDLPGFGEIIVFNCTPSATPASRAAGTGFNVPDSSSETFQLTSVGFPSTGAVSSNRAPANSLAIPGLGSGAPGTGPANEFVEVMIVRDSDGAVANVWIFEETDETDCVFTVRGLIS